MQKGPCRWLCWIRVLVIATCHKYMGDCLCFFAPWWPWDACQAAVRRCPLTEVSAQRNAAFRVIDGRQHVAQPLRRHALMEALPVTALGQDVHAVRPGDEAKEVQRKINQSIYFYLKAQNKGEMNKVSPRIAL